MQDWTPWHGIGQPKLFPAQTVEVRNRLGISQIKQAQHVSWWHYCNSPSDIVEYRVVD